VHKALKFSEVLGTSFPNNPISISPTGYPPIVMEKTAVLVISLSTRPLF